MEEAEGESAGWVDKITWKTVKSQTYQEHRDRCGQMFIKEHHYLHTLVCQMMMIHTTTSITCMPWHVRLLYIP